MAAAVGLTNVKISGTLPEHGRVVDYEISEDGASVVFKTYQDADLTEAIFSAPIDGSLPPRQLNDPLPTGDSIAVYKISPDSSRVIFLLLSLEPEARLFTVPLDGSTAPVSLTPPLENWTTFQAVDISPDNSRVLFTADLELDGATDLFSVPIDGSGSPVRLNEPLQTGHSVHRPAFSPDGSRVVYMAAQDSPDVVELYSVPSDGSEPPIKLNRPLVANGDVINFAISPDGSRVVYRADQLVDEMYALGSVPIDGSSEAVRLNAPLVSGGDVQYFYAISPDSQYVVYVADQTVDDVYELYSAAIDGSGPPVMLNGPLVSGGDVSDFHQISPDSSRIIYHADQETDGVSDLYAVSPDGSDLVKLNDPLPAGNSIRYHTISPDSNYAVFLGEEETTGAYVLYSVPLDGSAPPLVINDPLPAGGEVEYFQLSPDGQHVVYNADQDSDGVFELYRVPIDGSAASQKISGSLTAGGDVDYDFRIDPSSTHVLYIADQEADEVFELFATFEQLPQLSFAVDSASVPEDSNVAQVEVQLDDIYSETVQVDYAVTGGSASGGGVDYVLTGGTLTFDPGMVAQTIEILLVDDLVQESEETMEISLSNPQNAVLTANNSYTLTIEDDDQADEPPDDGDGDDGDTSAAYSLNLPLLIDQ
jgi:Tol biopolymer transport system component